MRYFFVNLSVPTRFDQFIHFSLLPYEKKLFLRNVQAKIELKWEEITSQILEKC